MLSLHLWSVRGLRPETRREDMRLVRDHQPPPLSPVTVWIVYYVASFSTLTRGSRSTQPRQARLDLTLVTFLTWPRLPCCDNVLLSTGVHKSHSSTLGGALGGWWEQLIIACLNWSMLLICEPICVRTECSQILIETKCSRTSLTCVSTERFL